MNDGGELIAGCGCIVGIIVIFATLWGFGFALGQFVVRALAA